MQTPIRTEQDGSLNWLLIDVAGAQIGRCVERENAEFILRACNGYADAVGVVRELATMDVKGHSLRDRLQFSTPSRALGARIDAVLSGNPLPSDPMREELARVAREALHWRLLDKQMPDTALNELRTAIAKHEGR